MRARSFFSGFTLIELLVVMVIIALVTSLVSIAIGPVLRSSALSQAGINVVQIFSLARQSAVSVNQIVEVRIYQYADSTFAGESTGSPSTGKYRSFQTFKITESNVAVALTPVQKLPSGVIVDSGRVLTSIFCVTPVSGNATNIALPVIGTAYNYQFFRIRPNGTMVFFTTVATTPNPPTLTSNPPTPPGTWCLTLHSITSGDDLTTPPKNFSTLQIDPASGAISTFRPD